MPDLFARVAVSELTYWLDKPYDYLVPESLKGSVKAGMRVYVPFSRGNRRAEGIVLSLSDKCDYDKPKAIISLLDEEAVLTPSQLKLAFWMRERFFCTVYEAVRAILPAGLWFSGDGKRKARDKMSEWIRLVVSAEDAYELAQFKRRKAPQQASVLSLLSAVYEGEVSEVRTLSGASRASIKALVDAGIAEFFYKECFRRPTFKQGKKQSLPELDESQSKAYEGLCALSDRKEASGALLFGVTGSGKTSVYIKLIDHVLSNDRAVLLLVPEIALTPQMLETFSSYFGDKIAVLHSSLSVTERYDEWKRVKKGEARLVIGTRSAIFAPTENLGLIIIDEEQEDTYKSESAPRYHARDVAKFRCQEEGALLLLGSATPDICSMHAADTGRYSFFCLPERYNKMSLPEVKIVDMKRELRRGNDSCISSFLKDELQKNIDAGEQSILFLNRRGSSRQLLCGECGYVPQCPRCSVYLTYHSANHRMMCHYC
ncbi:MAG: primosomal protein N', partial [Oscillospiraceae bacterium]|nr:primosomal protein N' [Oscillospiraceae bacterium]